MRRTKATLRAALFATLLVLGGIPPFAWGEVPTDLPNYPDSPIVQIAVPDEGYGSGVVIGQETVPGKGCKETIITNAHVVSMDWEGDKSPYWPAVIVQTANQAYAARVMAYDLSGDLALLEKWSGECLVEAPLTMSDTYVPHGTPVWTGGWLYGEELTTISGTVGHYRATGWYEGMDGLYMALSAAAKPGMSGGAVMLEGELVAIVSGRSRTAEFYTIAVPMWRIKQFLESYGSQ